MITRLSRTTIRAQDGEAYRAMVVQFVGDRVVRLHTVEAMQSQRVEQAFVDFAEAHAASAMIMRLSSPSGSWSADPEASDAELAKLCRILAAAHLPTYVALMNAGIEAIIHTDVPSRFAGAMRRASVQTAAEVAEEALGTQLDVPPERYLLENMSYYLTQGYEFLLERVLPRMLPRFHRRAPHVREQLASRE